MGGLTASFTSVTTNYMYMYTHTHTHTHTRSKVSSTTALSYTELYRGYSIV